MPNLLKTIILTAVLGFAPMTAFAEGSGHGGGNTNVDTNVNVGTNSEAVAGAIAHNNIAIVGVPSVNTSGDCAAGASFGNTAFAFGISGIPQFCKNLMMGQLAAQERENIPASWYNVAMKRALDIKDVPASKAGKSTSASAPAGSAAKTAPMQSLSDFKVADCETGAMRWVRGAAGIKAYNAGKTIVFQNGKTANKNGC